MTGQRVIGAAPNNVTPVLRGFSRESPSPLSGDTPKSSQLSRPGRPALTQDWENVQAGFVF